MTLIKIEGKEYTIKDFIRARDIPKLNPYVELAMKGMLLKDEGEIMKFIISNIEQAINLIEFFIVSPKLDEGIRINGMVEFFINPSFIKCVKDSLPSMDSLPISDEQKKVIQGLISQKN